MKFFSLIFSSFFYLIFFVSSAFANVTIFSDNFNSGSNKWQLARNVGNGLWLAEEGVFKAIFSQSGVSEQIPKDDYWNSNWNNYSLEVDMAFKTGVDKNLAFRYINSDNWYGVHFSGGMVSLQKVINGIQPLPFPIEVGGSYVNGQTYHIKIDVIDNKIDFFVDGNLIISYVDNHNPILNGKPALQASAGGVYYSEVWFDNVLED